MIRIAKGTKDILPTESYKWHFIEDTIRKLALDFGLNEIRTPTFEATELFVRGVGQTTDIVNKEMYTFNDKGNRSITLKPEGTAGVVRSYIENNLNSNIQPTKMFYLTPVFRYERPQSGRLREHHQFGIEYYGSNSPIADVEVMLVAKELFDRLKICNLQLRINSIGCKDCRKVHAQALAEFFADKKQDYCPLCQERMDKNPLRVLDCKVDKCTSLNLQAPSILNYLCDECDCYHNNILDLLNHLDIDYVVDPYIVRGLDYYTKTVFEFVSNDIGAKGTVCGGGRYDNLVAELGGKSTPAVGFGLGLERLIMVMENSNLYLGKEEVPLIYIAPIGDEQYKQALKIVHTLRRKGISAETDYMQRSLKAQMRYADKKKYRYTIVLGQDEIKANKCIVRDMYGDKEMEVSIDKLADLSIDVLQK